MLEISAGVADKIGQLKTRTGPGKKNIARNFGRGCGQKRPIEKKIKKFSKLYSNDIDKSELKVH